MAEKNLSESSGGDEQEPAGVPGQPPANDPMPPVADAGAAEPPPIPGAHADEVGFWIVTAELSDDPGGFPDIRFEWTGRAGEAPPELLEFRNRVDKTLGTLRLIYGDRSRRPHFDESFGKLLNLAQLGMVGLKPATREANAALDSLQWEILSREAGRIKNGYMLKLGKWALGFAAAASVLFFVFDRWAWIPPPQLYAYRNVLLVIAGCMAGAWASFASRKVILSFFDLAALEEDRLEPALRLLFTAVLTTILVLVFTTGFADVRIGAFQASQVLRSGSTAVLIGALCGLAEQALPAAVMMRAGAFMNASAGNAPRS